MIHYKKIVMVFFIANSVWAMDHEGITKELNAYLGLHFYRNFNPGCSDRKKRVKFLDSTYWDLVNNEPCKSAVSIFAGIAQTLPIPEATKFVQGMRFPRNVSATDDVVDLMYIMLQLDPGCMATKMRWCPLASLVKKLCTQQGQPIDAARDAAVMKALMEDVFLMCAPAQEGKKTKTYAMVPDRKNALRVFIALGARYHEAHHAQLNDLLGRASITDYDIYMPLLLNSSNALRDSTWRSMMQSLKTAQNAAFWADAFTRELLIRGLPITYTPEECNARLFELYLECKRVQSIAGVQRLVAKHPGLCITYPIF